MTALVAAISSMTAAAAPAAATTFTGTTAALGANIVADSAISAGAVGQGFSALSALNTGFTLASAGLSLFGGMQQSDAIAQQTKAEVRALEIQATDDMIAARQEELAGRQVALDIQDRLNRTISAQRLAFAANGVDPLFGTPMEVAAESRTIAGRQMSVTRSDAALRGLSRRRSAAERIVARGARIQSGSAAGSSAMLSGISGSVGAGLSYIGSEARRG